MKKGKKRGTDCQLRAADGKKKWGEESVKNVKNRSARKRGLDGGREEDTLGAPPISTGSRRTLRGGRGATEKKSRSMEK